MKKLDHLFVGIALLMIAACSGGDNVALENQTDSGNVVQEKVDEIMQPRITTLDNAKALEGKIMDADKKRLKTIEEFNAK